MKKFKIYILKLNFKNVKVWNLDFSSTFLKRKSLKFRFLKYITPFEMNNELLKIEIYGQIEPLTKASSNYSHILPISCVSIPVHLFVHACMCVVHKVGISTKSGSEL